MKNCRRYTIAYNNKVGWSPKEIINRIREWYKYVREIYKVGKTGNFSMGTSNVCTYLCWVINKNFKISAMTRKVVLFFDRIVCNWMHQQWTKQKKTLSEAPRRDFLLKRFPVLCESEIWKTKKNWLENRTFNEFFFSELMENEWRNNYFFDDA